MDSALLSSNREMNMAQSINAEQVKVGQSVRYSLWVGGREYNESMGRKAMIWEGVVTEVRNVRGDVFLTIKEAVGRADTISIYKDAVFPETSSDQDLLEAI